MGSTVLIDGLPSGSISDYAYHACFFKREWVDAWTWVPYVRARWAEESAAPSVAEASFEWIFGEVKQHFDATYRFYLPVLVQNAYVMVRTYNEWGDWPVFIGSVQRETAAVHGTAWPQGDQAFSAFSIEHLFDRNQINGAWTESGFIERAVAFNRKDAHGLVEQGNRSESVTDDGVYTFSRDGEKWTNLDIIEYLLWNFVDDGIDIVIAGSTGPLDQIIEEHDFYGQSVLAALNQLIDRRYGLNWRLLVPDTPGGTVYLYVFSQLAFPLQIGDVEVPANPVQSVVPILGDHAVDPVLTFDALNQYDSVEVRGANILVCGSFSYADETLEKGWTDAEQASYDDPGHGDSDENDRARRAELFDNIYQKHRVPRDWDGHCGDGAGGDQYNAHPFVTNDSEVVWDEQSPFWMGDRKFDNEIPIETETLDEDAPVDYRRAFAVVKHPDEDAYSYVEKAWPEDDTARFPGNMTIAQREMGIVVRPEINHVYGKNHFTNEDTNIEPAFDYESLIVTAAFRVDAQLRAIGQVPGQHITETGRTKIILVPDAQYWVILPNTVTDVVDGELVREFADYEIVRDDSARLRQILALSLVWFGFARGTMALRYKAITPAWPVGSLILGLEGTWHATVLGTVVTRKRWVFDTNTTEINTGNEELVFREGVMRMKKAALR